MKTYNDNEFKNHLTAAFRSELTQAKKARADGEMEREWQHLERAHILGQYRATQHFQVHVLMMFFSLRHFQILEFLGQIPRLVLSIPGSLTGLAPKGNTGGSNVGIFQPMEIPSDLKIYLESDQNFNG